MRGDLWDEVDDALHYYYSLLQAAAVVSLVHRATFFLLSFPFFCPSCSLDRTSMYRHCFFVLGDMARFW